MFEAHYLELISMALLVVAAGWLGVVAHNRRKELTMLCGAIDALPAPRQIVSTSGQVLYSNPASLDLVGRSSKPLYTLLGEWLDGDETQTAQLDQLVKGASKGMGGSLEVTVPGRAGEDNFFRIGANPVPSSGGSVFWYLEDITLSKRMEDLLTEEHNSFMEMLQGAPLGFYVCDNEGRFLFLNESLAGWLGKAPKALTGQNARLQDLALGKDPSLPPYLLAPMQGELPVETILKGPEGSPVTVLVSQDVIKEPGGKVERVRGTVRNLSVEKDTAAALEEAGQRFRRLFDRAPIGLATLEADMSVAEHNRAFRELTGRDDDGLSGCLLEELFVGEDHEALAKAAGEILRNPGADLAPLELTLSCDPPRICAVSLSLLDRDRPERGYVVYLLDITEHKTLEAQFAQGQKMQAVGQLAGGIAHDFNNLLTAMIGFCDLLLLRHRPGDQSFGDIMQIRQNANRAANLVRQLLAFSRQQSLQPSVLNVTDILAELSHLLRRLLGEAVELKVYHGRDLGHVRADQGQLEQVIINLSVNARDAMPEGGALEIKTAPVHLDTPLRREGEIVPPGDYVRIIFADTGSGIAPENVGRIFDPFFSTKEIGEGTGLGLSTVYGIIKQTDGFIFVESALGEGTTFELYLPSVPAKDGQAAAQPTEGLSKGEARDLTGIGTVLLVEDEDAVRSFSARALRNKGYKVLEAESGEAALELLQGHRDEDRGIPPNIDLLITDVVMPRLDGPSLVKQVRGDRPNLRVIFISGYAEDSFRKRLGEEPDIHFLAKPYTLRELAGKVKEVMDEEHV